MNVRPVRAIGIYLVLAFADGALACRSSAPPRPGGKDALDSFKAWQFIELTFTAEQDHDNPYTDETIWVSLTGPEGSGYEGRRVFGFWDGDRTFRVRLVGTQPGLWHWESHARSGDRGLAGKRGSFRVTAWSEADKRANPNRRGFVRASGSRRALVYADGTPFFMVAQTWWGASTARVPLRGMPARPDTVGQGLHASNWSFENAIGTLASHGYNTLAMVAAHPNWAEDGQPKWLNDDDEVPLRHCKPKSGSDTCRDMRDEQGNRPFALPGKCKGFGAYCADFDRINPAYFQSLDAKVRHLHEHGFVAYVESLRRDQSVAWKAYHDWTTSFPRYLNYLQARYGAFNVIFSLAHIDFWGQPTLTAVDWAAAFDAFHARYGGMPFGQIITTMAVHSSLDTFGHPPANPWIQAHSVGNEPKDHSQLVSLENMARQQPPLPFFNNEPHYVGWQNPVNAVDGELPPANSERDNYFARAMAYGSVLSGALAGHVFGDGSRWNNTVGDVADPDHPPPWQCLQFDIHGQVRHLKSFVAAAGAGFADLRLGRDDLPRGKAPGSSEHGLEGWAYLMHSPGRDLALLYFEKKALRQVLTGFPAGARYEAQYYDPRRGHWLSALVTSVDDAGVLSLPPFPDGDEQAREDWAMKLVRRGAE